MVASNIVDPKGSIFSNINVKGTLTATGDTAITGAVSAATVSGKLALNAIGTKTTAATVVALKKNDLTLTNGNTCVLAFPAAADGSWFDLWVRQPASTGSGIVTWPASAKFPGGTALVVTTGGGKLDHFLFKSDGTIWSCSLASQDVR